MKLLTCMLHLLQKRMQFAQRILLLCRYLEVDDRGGVYAQLQLPTWPQRSAEALVGFSRQYWAIASSTFIQKVGLH